MEQQEWYHLQKARKWKLRICVPMLASTCHFERLFPQVMREPWAYIIINHACLMDPHRWTPSSSLLKGRLHFKLRSRSGLACGLVASLPRTAALSGSVTMHSPQPPSPNRGQKLGSKMFHNVPTTYTVLQQTCSVHPPGAGYHTGFFPWYLFTETYRQGRNHYLHFTNEKN